IVGIKMHKAFPLPVIEFPLLEEVPTASEKNSHCQKKRDATAVKIALLLKSRRKCIASDGTGKKRGMTESLTADDMQKRKNDTGKKISIQGTDVAVFDKSKVERFNCHKMSHFARECRAPRSQDRGRRDNYGQWSKVEEQAPKALMEIDRKKGPDSKLAGFQTASKDLDSLPESQRLDKNKEGLGYSAVPPPPPAQIYSPPKKDMS
nr:hypothetical protein [Tanacetum cinerariifolium]